jgi:hypothetical protein
MAWHGYQDSHLTVDGYIWQVLMYVIKIDLHSSRQNVIYAMLLWIEHVPDEDSS